MNIFQKIYPLLLSSGSRLPEIEFLLMEEIWSVERFERCDRQKYFEEGERLVREAEDTILACAPQIYDEIVAAAESSPNYLSEFGKEKTALVILDGTSIRELPLLLQLAGSTGLMVKEARYGLAALPSDTLGFVEQRLLGKRISPSQLESRKELKDAGIKTRYYDTSIRVFELHGLGDSLLLWSSFPDGTYMNFEARSSGHFDAISKQFDVVWKNIVLSIPNDFRIIVTSDHGYAYLGVGFESEFKAENALGALDNYRYKLFQPSEDLPPPMNELQVIPHRRTAMLRGRVKNRPQGPSANKLFRHGGMSLMEMLTPYLVLTRTSKE